MGEQDTLQATLLFSLQEVADESDDEDMLAALEASGILMTEKEEEAKAAPDMLSALEAVRLLMVHEEEEVKGGADKAPAAAEASTTQSFPVSTLATTY